MTDTAMEDEDLIIDATHRLLQAHGPRLLRLAAWSISYGLEHGAPPPIDPDKEAPELRASGACFVTLKKAARLRGCIGSPRAYQPLAKDVVGNGFSAAFRDHRFPSLEADEVPSLDLSVSVLSAQSPIAISSQSDLLSKLRPNVDGLVIADGERRALFLPSVWAQLPQPQSFLQSLKLKAGMTADHWSCDFKAWRFVAEEVKAADLPDSSSIWLV